MEKLIDGCPCDNCDVGWGSMDYEKVETCYQTCQLYLAWQKNKEVSDART